MATVEDGNGNGNYQPRTFEWQTALDIANYNYSQFSKVSSFFHFCGYYCQLYCNTDYDENGTSCIGIGLKGYPAPYQKNVSCYYSLSLINNKGAEVFTKERRIHFSEKTIHEVIKKFSSQQLTGDSTLFTFCFSWCEERGSASELENQAEPVIDARMSTSVLECATQTEDMLFLNTVSSSDVIERSTQTEFTQSALEGDTFTSKENKTFKFLEILSKDLGSFYDGKMEPDCVLNVGATKFPVHRSLLSARSTVFAAMFYHDTSESRSGEVDIQDVDAVIFSDVIYYMYTGKIRGLSPDTATAMYTAADKYALIELREECLDFLVNNLTVENICDASLLSHSHAEEKLEIEVVGFIKSRLRELTGRENWKQFLDNHPKLGNKLLCSALIAS